MPADHLIPALSVVQPSAEPAGGNRTCDGDIETRLTPIETLQVGQRVRADAPTDEVDRQFGDEVIPSEWRKLTLTAPKRDGTVSDVLLLRPREWLAQQQAEVGGQVYIAVPECGIDGNATVRSIEPCPPITDGPGRVITGTFRHRVAVGIELSIGGEPQPIRCTGNHPIWSESRQDFVRADSLEPGESLRTTTGLTHLVSASSLPGETYVYNLEVHGLHVYHVGASGVLVHNGADDDCLKTLYRVISEEEWLDICKNGKFKFPEWGDTPTGEPGKFFWGSLAEAKEFQRIWYRFGETSHIVRSIVPNDTRIWRQGGIVDGIGDPYFVPIDVLNNLIEKLK